jgi:branched-chain amino acid transport system substrate-binding protein
MQVVFICVEKCYIRLINIFNSSFFVREKKVRRKTLFGIVLLLAAISMLTFSIPVKAEKTEVVVGWAHPLTTPAAGPTAIHHAYYKMLIEDYNAKGGLYIPELGKRLPIRYIEYDNEFDPAKTLTLYERLILEDQVDLLFGPWGTAFNTLVAPLTERHQFPLVGLTVGSDSLSEAMMRGEYRWMFLTLGVPWEDGENLAQLFTYINENVKEEWKIRKVGITYRSDEHGIEHATGISEKLAEIGIEVPVLEMYDAVNPPTDWTPIITKFKEAGVDVAMLCGYDEGAFFVHGCIALDYNPKLLFIGPVMELSFLVFGPFGFTYGQMAGVTYYNGFPGTNFKSVPAYWDWAIEHEQRLGYLPFPASLSFYCGLESLFLAVEEHGLNRAAIRDALETETFNTKAGKYKFRVGRSPEIENHGTISQWQGGELMEVVWPLDKKTSAVIYPKLPWYWAEMPDIKRDGKIDITDVFLLAKAFGTSKPFPRHPRWNPAADVNNDGKVNIGDVFQIAKNFGKKVTYPW